MLIEKTKVRLTKQNTRLRKPLDPEEKLAVTLRFLATGESYSSLSYQYRISTSAISCFVPDVCEVIYDVLVDEYMKFPQNKEEWLHLAKEYEERWQFPNCFAAVDGKHIALFHPSLSGSIYYNYKGFHSIVLMALVDANYKFIYVDVSCQGRLSDGGVFKNTSFYKLLINGKLNLPEPRQLPIISGHNDSFLNHAEERPMLPYIYVGDDAFSLSIHCMKPYAQQGLSNSKRIFNYRLSWARRTTENAFGILVHRFRALLSRLNLCPQTATKVVLAICALHNLLRTQSLNTYCPPGYEDEVYPNGELRNGE